MENTYFISFEGIDGSGKDTQLYKLVEEIKEDNNGLFGNKYSNIWVTREPTKITQSGIKISNLIRERDVSGEEASELYVQDRIEHTKIIRQTLEHSHVLTSRYDISTLSYQMTQGISLDFLYEMHCFEKGICIIPDLTIVFDLPAEVALGRTQKRNSKLECFEKLDFQIKARENLLKCVKYLREKGRDIIIINANQPIEKVTQEMLEKIKQILQ